MSGFVPGNHRQWKTGLGPPMRSVEPGKPLPPAWPAQLAIFIFWVGCMAAGAWAAFQVLGK